MAQPRLRNSPCTPQAWWPTVPPPMGSPPPVATPTSVGCGYRLLSSPMYAHGQRKYNFSISLNYKNKLHMAFLSCGISFLLFPSRHPTPTRSRVKGGERLRPPLQTAVPRVSSESSRIITQIRAPVRLNTPSRDLKPSVSLPHKALQ